MLRASSIAASDGSAAKQSNFEEWASAKTHDGGDDGLRELSDAGIVLTHVMIEGFDFGGDPHRIGRVPQQHIQFRAETIIGIADTSQTSEKRETVDQNGCCEDEENQLRDGATIHVRTMVNGTWTTRAI